MSYRELKESLEYHEFIERVLEAEPQIFAKWSRILAIADKPSTLAIKLTKEIMESKSVSPTELTQLCEYTTGLFQAILDLNPYLIYLEDPSKVKVRASR